MYNDNSNNDSDNNNNNNCTIHIYIYIYTYVIHIERERDIYTHVIPYFTILHYTTLYYTILYHDILYYTTLHYTTLYYIMIMSAPESCAGRGRRREELSQSVRSVFKMSVSCYVSLCIMYTWFIIGSIIITIVIISRITVSFQNFMFVFAA